MPSVIVLAPSFPTIEIGPFTLKEYDEERIIIVNSETEDAGVFRKDELTDYLRAFYGEKF